jgi:hypothetical protein
MGDVDSGYLHSLEDCRYKDRDTDNVLRSGEKYLCPTCKSRIKQHGVIDSLRLMYILCFSRKAMEIVFKNMFHFHELKNYNECELHQLGFLPGDISLIK